MKNRLHIIRAIFLIVIIMSVYSCGPVATVLTIESRLPAKYPIELENKSIALFVSADTSINKGSYLSQNDSVHMVAVATGIAAELEKKLMLNEGAVFVFNHYPGNNREYELPYIQNLSFTSNSDVIVVLDSLRIGSPKLIDNRAGTAYELYKSNFIFAPIFTDIKIFNGTTANLVSHIRQIDTVYWELLSRSDVREEALLYRVNNSVEAIAQNIGEELVNKIFPSWVEQQRTLYRFPNGNWPRAHSLATQFMWAEAMKIWLSETAGKDNIKVAAAAFNMAVACELTNRLDLALEWIELSHKSYSLPGVISYKQFLKEKFESK